MDVCAFADNNPHSNPYGDKMRAFIGLIAWFFYKALGRDWNE